MQDDGARDDMTVIIEHDGKTVETTPEALEELARNIASSEPESRWSEYGEAPEVLQELAAQVRERDHKVLEQARIDVVMHPKWQRQDNAPVAMRVKIADAVTRATDGVDAWIIVSGPWYDDNNPRQENSPEGAVSGLPDVNRRMCEMMIDACLCRLSWNGEKLVPVKPVGIFPAIVRRWGVMPLSEAQKIERIMIERENQGLGFLVPLQEQEDDEPQANEPDTP